MEENKPEEKEQKTISIKLTEEEVIADMEDLKRDEEINLFLKVQNGQRKFQKLLDLEKALNNK